MSVDDHGLEVLKKSAYEITPGNKSEYGLKAKILEMPAIVVDIPPVTIDTTGLATDARQDAQTALLTQIKAIQTDGTQHTIVDAMPAVSVDTTGLATETKQDDEITQLAAIVVKLEAIRVLLVSIDGKLTSPITVVTS